MQAHPVPAAAGPNRPRDSMLRQWVWRVVMPLTLAVLVAFCLLAYGAWQLSRAPMASGLLPALWISGLLMLGALALVIALSLDIAVQVLRPLDELGMAMERLGRGEPVHVHLLRREGAIRRLQQGVNQASSLLSSARNRMQSELGRASIELADKNAKLEAASQARSRLLAAASHDLRQPLYALTLFSSTLRAGETDPDKLARMMHIEECVASLDQLFSELLDLSRLEAGSMRAEPVDVRLDSVFDEVSRNFRMLAESRGLRLVVRKTDAWVHCDRTMLARILNNLVSNALRYTDVGGVLIGVRHQASGKVRVDVWDTGCGIAPEHQQRVFEEFYQVKPAPSRVGEPRRGLGLGLATVQRLAELTGCRVELGSRPGRGTRVSLLLDSCPAAAPSSTDGCDLPLDISGLRVLGIDDEPSILEGLRTLLREWGCEIRTASDEAGALACLTGWDAPPDLVISDLHLQDGHNGLQVLHAIARHYRQDPQHPAFARLLVTGETRPDRVDEIAASRVPVLFKPVPPQRLREAMLAAVFAARAERD